MATTSYYETVSGICFSVSNMIQRADWNAIFSAFYHQMRIAIPSKKQLRTKYIKHIVECLNGVERFAMPRLKWIAKPTLKVGI